MATSSSSISKPWSVRSRGPTGLLCAALLWVIVLPALAAPTAEMVSDNPGLILASSQAWGELGLNEAAHLPGRPALPLQIGEKHYDKGLGSHAAGEIVLALDGQYLRFEAEIGVQKQPGNCGSVVFRAIADGREVFQSGTMDGPTPAQAISLPVRDVEELRLVVTDAGDGISCDLGNWADARLTPAPGTGPARLADSLVDVARFGRVATWDPARLDGARADRIQEFRAEDVFTETELQPGRDGEYAVPAWTNGLGCIGLQWLNRRALRELVLEFAGASTIPATGSMRVEAWHGESAWQGSWRPLTNELRQEGRRFICDLIPKVGVVQTRKARWIFPVSSEPTQVRLAAFTRSRWSVTNLYVEIENPQAGAQGTVTIENGEAVGQARVRTSGTGREEIPWPLSSSLQLAVRYSRPSPFKSDPTLLQFHLPAGDLSVAVEDVLANDGVYLPDFGLFVARMPLPGTLAEYKKRIAARKTILAEVRALPDQTLTQAMAQTHHAAQREGPVLLSLAGDNSKFQLERDGVLSWLLCTNAVAASHETRLNLKPAFGDGKSDGLTRKLDGGWLPIPVIEVPADGVTYRQCTFVAPADEAGDKPGRLDRRSVCVVEFTVTNTLAQPADAAVSLAFNVPGDAQIGLTPNPNGWQLAVLEKSLAWITTEGAAPLTATAQGGVLRLSGTLSAEGVARVVVFLPAEAGTKPTFQTPSQFRVATEDYWKAMLASAMQVETPDPLLNDVIRASQVRCWIDARSEAAGARVAAWIAAISYGPLESEAHSVIRGMDMIGHEEFARRSLDFFIHRYNTNGFLTTGYTTFGTAWHLWTLGEHYQLTRDTNWLRQVAPQVARVCHWVVRQTEKTEKLDPYGRPVPEYGLMPPGVLADWNAFAYHFAMNGYYVAALREAGHALGDIGHRDAGLFLQQAEALRANTLRAYAWTQARAPALPLRDGTWIPHYPSQVHSPGNLADFFPGQDAGRSWCYGVELGAHQLVPCGLLDPQSREVERLMDHMEDVQFLADGWFDYPAATNRAEWFNNGGFSKVQPYYTRNAEIYALRDDVKPFVRSYFNTLAAMLNPEVLTLWEHFHHSGAWDKTHETGYFLQQTRFMLAMEHNDELWLAPLITSHWLEDGQTVRVANAPTRFGKTSYHLGSHVKAGYIEARIEPPTRSAPRAIVLRLRHPEGKPIRLVTVNGKPHAGFDAQREIITLRPNPGPLEVRAEY